MTDFMIDPAAVYDCSQYIKCAGFSQCMLAKTPSEVIPGQDLNHKNDLGWTPLMIHARNGNFDMVQYLITAGADVNLQDADGWTALHIAARYSTKGSSEDIVSMLITAGADVNLQEYDGWTALHLTSRNSTEESSENTVAMLIAAGADVNLQENDGNTPLDLADSKQVAVRLLLAGAKTSSDVNGQLLEYLTAELLATRKLLEETRLDGRMHREFYEHYHGYLQLG